MFKIGDKVKVINSGVSCIGYENFYKAHSIMNLYALSIGRFLENGLIGTVEFIGADSDSEDIVLVVVSVNGTMYLIKHEGLELVAEETNKNKYSLKRKTMSEEISTKNFKVERYQTDDTYTLYFENYLMVEMLNSEEIDELIYILQEAKKLKQ